MKQSSKSINVRAIDFVMFCAGDPESTRAWYQDLFGLKKGEEWHHFWSEFDTQPVAFCLNGPPLPEDSEDWDWQGVPAIAFAIEDMQTAVAVCRERGVRILKGPVETSVCWMCFIEDPDGNRIVLHQRKDGTAG